MMPPTTRRALLGGAGLAGVALAMPAARAAAAPTEFARLHARSEAARHRFNTLPEDLEYSDPARWEHEAALMHEATDAFDKAAPNNLVELVIAMENRIGGGNYGGRKMCDELVEHARRIAGGRA